jgi:integrase/recombinase XerD
MTELRRRMIQELQLRGYSERTVQAYVHPVAQLARHYGTSPDRLTEEQVRDYLQHLTQVPKVSPSTHTIALCGIKFFYQHTLGRDWRVLEIARPGPRRNCPRC